MNKIQKKQNELPTENATIYYHPSGIDICIYLIKTDSNYHYTVENLEETFREHNLRVKISYTEIIKFNYRMLFVNSKFMFKR